MMYFHMHRAFFPRNAMISHNLSACRTLVLKEMTVVINTQRSVLITRPFVTLPFFVSEIDSRDCRIRVESNKEKCHQLLQPARFIQKMPETLARTTGFLEKITESSRLHPG
ncbi:MAG: hypothetical protein ACI9ZF_002504 [Bradyrhizobium sp.]|jgi:hypothetical protein